MSNPAPRHDPQAQPLGVLAMLAYAAAFDLDHAAEWIVVGGICFAALGAIVAVESR